MQPPAQAPMVQQPGQPFGAATPDGGARRPGLIGAGALILAAGVVGGVVMLLASSSNYDEGVKNLARAPIGCTTSLQFDEAGTYTIYLETKGQVGALRGDCPNADRDYDLGDNDLPDVTITLLNDDGDEIDLDDDDSKDYDAGGAAGSSIASVKIEQAGDYEITATVDDGADGGEVAIAVGRNPKASASSLKTTGIVVLALGVVLGGLLMALGLRRRAPGAPGSSPSAAPPAPGAYVPAPQAPYPAAPAPGQYQPPSYQPPAPPAPPAPQAPPSVMPPLPPSPPTPPQGGGPAWPAPPSS
jgi:hypothetical protein